MIGRLGRWLLVGGLAAGGITVHATQAYADCAGYAATYSGFTSGADTHSNNANDSDSWDSLAGNDTLHSGPSGGQPIGDHICGNDDNDNIYLEAGPDWGYAGDGADYVEGGAGADYVDGYLGIDTINGGDDGDGLWGFDGPDNIDGQAGNDSVNGEKGNDTLYGRNGVDTLVGGQDSDACDAGGDPGDAEYNCETNP